MEEEIAELLDKCLNLRLGLHRSLVAPIVSRPAAAD